MFYSTKDRKKTLQSFLIDVETKEFQIDVSISLHYYIHAYPNENCRQMFTRAIFNFTISDSYSMNISSFNLLIMYWYFVTFMLSRLGNFSGRHLYSVIGRTLTEAVKYLSTHSVIKLLEEFCIRVGSYWVLKEDRKVITWCIKKWLLLPPPFHWNYAETTDGFCNIRTICQMAESKCIM